MATSTQSSRRASSLGKVDKENLPLTPNLDFKIGQFLTAQRGGDPSNERENVVSSRTQKAKDMKKQMADNKDKRLLDRVMNFKPPRVDPKDSIESQYIQGAQNERSVRERQAAGLSVLTKRGFEVDMELLDLAKQDRALRKQQRIKESKVNEEFGAVIAQVQNEALTARSMLRSELSHLSPSQRARVLAAQGSMFTSRINSLNQLKKAKLNAIGVAFDEEQDAIDDDIDSLNEVIASQKKTRADMIAAGAHSLAIAQLDTELAKNLERVRKKKKGGLTTLEELIKQRLLNITADKGYLNDSRMDSEASRQAKNIVANMRSSNMSMEPKGIGIFADDQMSQEFKQFNEDTGQLEDLSASPTGVN